MKLMITLLLGVALLFAGGCAEQQADYYAAISSTNTALVQSIQSQATANAKQRVDERLAFSRAMTEASKTPDPSDNAVIAFAWGFSTGQQPAVVVPSLAFPERPRDGVDYLGAALPYANLLFPWLMWGTGGGPGASQKITATDNATVMIDAGNAGSYNQASRSSAIDASGSDVDNQHDDYAIEGEDLGEFSGFGEGIATIQPTDGSDPDAPEGCGSEAYFSGGTWYVSPSSGCSCESRAEGQC